MLIPGAVMRRGLLIRAVCFWVAGVVVLAYPWLVGGGVSLEYMSPRRAPNDVQWLVWMMMLAAGLVLSGFYYFQRWRNGG